MRKHTEDIGQSTETTVSFVGLLSLILQLIDLSTYQWFQFASNCLQNTELLCD